MRPAVKSSRPHESAESKLGARKNRTQVRCNERLRGSPSGAISRLAPSWAACEGHPSREICNWDRPEVVESPSFWVPTRARSARICTLPRVKPLFPCKYVTTFEVYVNDTYAVIIYTHEGKKGGVSWIHANKEDKNLLQRVQAHSATTELSGASLPPLETAPGTPSTWRQNGVLVPTSSRAARHVSTFTLRASF